MARLLIWARRLRSHWVLGLAFDSHIAVLPENAVALANLLVLGESGGRPYAPPPGGSGALTAVLDAREITAEEAAAFGARRFCSAACQSRTKAAAFCARQAVT